MAQGIKEFVLRTNGFTQLDGADDAKPAKRNSDRDLTEGLKVSVPHTMKHAKMQANYGRSRNGARSPAGDPRSHLKHKATPNIFDTDASEADRTSVGDSAHPLAHSPLYDDNLGPQDQGASGQREQGPDAEEKHFEDSHGAGGLHPSVGPASFLRRTVKGDSMPSTSEGKPSEAELYDLHAAKSNALPTPKNHSHHYAAQSRDTRRNAAGFAVPVSSHAPSEEQHPPAASGSRNDTIDYAPGFAYAAAPSFNANMSRKHPSQPRPEPLAHHAAQAPVTHHAVNNQPYVRDQAASHPLAAHSQVENERFDGVHGNRSDGSRNRSAHGEARSASLYGSSMYNAAPSEKILPSHVHERNGMQDGVSGQDPSAPQTLDPKLGKGPAFSRMMRQSGHGGRVHADIDSRAGRNIPEGYMEISSPECDFDPPELYSMDFSDLKSRAFDLDPRAETVDFPRMTTTSTLQDKLKIAMSYDPNLQCQFFETLDVNSWETAGDWFLDQFGGIVNKLKESRQEKRKVAIEFEQEIEKRHEAVAKKQKLTRDALADMRESGGKVLQGTPKKTRKPAT